MAIGDNREEVRAGVRKGSQSPCGEVARSCPSCLPEDITRLMTDHAYGAADEVISGRSRRIPDRLLDECSVTGSAEEIAGHLARIGRLGVGQAALWLLPPRGGDLDGQIRLLAEKVVPRVWATLASR